MTAYLSPDRPPVITQAPVATNHQERVEWVSHARETATVERERYLLTQLALHPDTEARFIGAFLRPPLYSLAFERGFGTLYTAALRPRSGEIVYRWPAAEWRQGLDDFRPGSIVVTYPTVPERRIS